MSSLSRGGLVGDRAFRLLVEVLFVDAMVDIFTDAFLGGYYGLGGGRRRRRSKKRRGFGIL